MECKHVFNGEFLSKHMTKKFYNKDLRDAQAKNFLDKEKSKLPETLMKIEDEREKQEKINDLNNKIEELMQLRNSLRYNKTVHNKRQFVRACPVEDCRGFLSTQWKCSLCSNFTCQHCHLPLIDTSKENHVCDDNDVKTAQLLKKDTKPCPKCSFGIFKIDGCQQMFCTMCHTSFDWATGSIIMKNLHNPHYFEYQRNINNGIIPRNLDDNPDQCITFHDIRSMTIPVYEKKNIGEYLRFYTHIRNVERPRFDRGNIEYDLEFLRRQYLLKSINEKIWHSKLKAIFKKKEKNNELIQIFDMFTTMGFALLQQINSSNFSEMLNQLQQLQNYTNGVLQNISKRFDNTVPQIKWYSRAGWKDIPTKICTCRASWMPFDPNGRDQSCRCYNYLALLSAKF